MYKFRMICNNFEILRASKEGVTGNGREGPEPFTSSLEALFILEDE